MKNAASKAKEAPELLCRFISPYTDLIEIASIADKVFSDEEMTDLFIELANRHFLIPTVYQQLCQHQLDDKINTAELLEYMQTMSIFMAERNEALSLQLKEIIQEVNQHDLTPLIMKGSSTLFSDVYPNRGIRFMSDLDILFTEGEVADASKAMELLGYDTPEKYLSIVVNKQSHHLAPVYRKGAPCAVEIHIKPLKSHYRYLPADQVFANSIVVSELHDDELSAVRMSPEDEVIYCFAHAQLAHGYYRNGIFDLRQMDFFVRLVFSHQEQLDWDEIHARIYEGKDQQIFQHFVYCINKLFATSYPIKTEVISEKKLENYYQRNIASCFPRYYFIWRATRLFHEVSWIFAKQTLQGEYEITNTVSLLKARLRRFSALLKRYSHPMKLISRLYLAIRRAG